LQLYTDLLDIKVVFFCILQLHEVTESTYKDHFTDHPFSSSDFGKARSFEVLQAANRWLCRKLRQRDAL